MADYIPCSHCKGKGRIQLTGVHADTLKLLRKQSKALNGVELAKIARCQPTAMNNRLAWLESQGLAKRTRYGRDSFWRAAEV